MSERDDKDCPICRWGDGTHNSSCWIGALAIKWRAAERELELAREAQRLMALEVDLLRRHRDAGGTGGEGTA